MPSFCTSCGAALNGPFCAACGQPVANTQPPPVQPPAVTTTTRKGSPLLIAGIALLAFFGLAAAGAVYGVYWLKNKAQDRIAAYTGGAVGHSSRRASGNVNRQVCGLLTTEDLAQILGVTIEKSAAVTEENEPGCAYFTNSDGFATLRRLAVEQAKKDSETASQDKSLDKSDNPLVLLKHTKELEGIVKTFGMEADDKDGRVFAFSLDSQFDRGNWDALRTTLSVVPGFEELPGVGDRAMIGSFGHALYVLKGDTIIRLQLIHVPEARTRGAEIGRRIASRM